MKAYLRGQQGLEALQLEQSRPVSQGEIDADLSFYGFDPDEAYPEHGHDAIRQEWMAGRDDAMVRAFRCVEPAMLAMIAELRALRDFGGEPS